MYSKLNMKLHVFAPEADNVNINNLVKYKGDSYYYLYSYEITHRFTAIQKKLQNLSIAEEDLFKTCFYTWIRTYATYLDIRKDVLADANEYELSFIRSDWFWICLQNIPNIFTLDKKVKQSFFDLYPLIEEKDIDMKLEDPMNIDLWTDRLSLFLYAQPEIKFKDSKDFFLFVSDDPDKKSIIFNKGDELHGYY